MEDTLFFPCLRQIIFNTAALGLNSIYFKSNLHTTFFLILWCAQGLMVV